jgi:hypothetical protein
MPDTEPTDAVSEADYHAFLRVLRAIEPAIKRWNAIGTGFTIAPGCWADEYVDIQATIDCDGDTLYLFDAGYYGDSDRGSIDPRVFWDEGLSDKLRAEYATATERMQAENAEKQRAADLKNLADLKEKYPDA